MVRKTLWVWMSQSSVPEPRHSGVDRGGQGGGGQKPFKAEKLLEVKTRDLQEVRFMTLSLNWVIRCYVQIYEKVII